MEPLRIDVATMVAGRLPLEMRDRCIALGEDGIVALVRAACVGGAAGELKEGGAAGEGFVYGIVHAHAETVELTSKKAHKGDMIAGLCGRRIMIDAKNYAAGRAVPAAELDKFKRDMEASASCDAGLVVNLGGGGFAHQARRALVCERVIVGGRRAPIMYLNLAVATLGADATRDCITFALDALAQFDKSEELVMLSVDEVTAQLDALSECRDALEDTRASIDKQLKKLGAMMQTAEITLRAAIKRSRLAAPAFS